MALYTHSLNPEQRNKRDYAMQEDQGLVSANLSNIKQDIVKA